MSNHQDINERIVLYLKTRRIRQIDLEKKGYGSKQTINNIWHNKRKPSIDFLINILNDDKELSSEWLLTGKGKMFINPTTVKTVYELLAQLEKKQEEIDLLTDQIRDLTDHKR